MTKSFFDAFSVVLDLDHTHSLASFQWSGLSNQQTFLSTKNCLQIWKWFPFKGRGVFSVPICANKVRNGPASSDQGHSRVNQDSHHVHGTSIYPTFFASTNLSSKQIAITDNKRPSQMTPVVKESNTTEDSRSQCWLSQTMSLESLQEQL